MSRNMEAALVLTARDEASRPLARSLHDITRLASEAGKVMGSSGQTGSRAMQQLGAESKVTGQAVSGIARQASAAGQVVTNATAAGSRGMTQVADHTRSAERAVIGLTRESQRMASARQQLGMRAEQLIQREIRQTEAAYQRLARSGRLSASEQMRAYESMRDKVAQLRREMGMAERAVIGLSRESQRMASAREQLGVRAEQTIQREIRQTEAAYQRLASSGKLSATEQARAYQAMREQVAGLKREMQGVVEQQGKLGRAGRGLVAAGSGAVAGAYVLNRPLTSIADYDLRLRNMANIAYTERDVAGRKAGMNEMRSVIAKSGGNRDAAAEALDNMLASGEFEGDTGRKRAFDLLPVVMKYATAGNANPNELVNVALKAKKTFNVDDPAKALEMALLGGQLGGFEIKDQSAWLPRQMAGASAAGMRGPAGLAKLIALNQSALATAGTKDEAGNNVVNFLNKLNAEETDKDFKKAGIKDWRQRLVNGINSGRDAVDVFGDTIDSMVQKNPAYRKLQARLATETGEQKKATLEQMSKIIQGAVVGQISSDQQELMAVIAYLNNRKQQDSMEGRIRDVKPGEVSDTNLALIKESEAWKGQQFDNAIAEGQFDALKGLSETVGDAKLKLVEYAGQYPALSTALVGAGTAVTALAAAATAASLPLLMMGKGSGVPLPGGLPGGAPAKGTIAGGMGLAVRAGVAGVLSYFALQGAKAAGLPDVDKTQGQKDLKNGDLLGASLHLPAGEFLSAWWHNEHKKAAPPARPASPFAPPASSPYPARNTPASLPVPQLSVLQSAVSASARMDAAALKFQQAVSQPQPVHVTVDVKNGNIVAAVNTANSFTARRN